VIKASFYWKGAVKKDFRCTRRVSKQQTNPRVAGLGWGGLALGGQWEIPSGSREDSIRRQAGENDLSKLFHVDLGGEKTAPLGEN